MPLPLSFDVGKFPIARSLPASRQPEISSICRNATSGFVASKSLTRTCDLGRVKLTPVRPPANIAPFGCGPPRKRRSLVPAGTPGCSSRRDASSFRASNHASGPEPRLRRRVSVDPHPEHALAVDARTSIVSLILHGLADIVRHHQHGRPTFGRSASKTMVLQHVGTALVERNERLVQHQQIRLDREGPGEERHAAPSQGKVDWA